MLPKICIIHYFEHKSGVRVVPEKRLKEEGSKKYEALN